MKVLILSFTLLLFFLMACKKSLVTLNDDHPGQIIAIQPLDDINIPEIDSIIKEVSSFYNKRIIILKSVKIPLTFINQEIEKYSGDSILMLLSKIAKDSIVEIVGLTNHPIFTIKEAHPLPYYDEKIFGIGHEPGNSCLVSTHRFNTNDKQVFHCRLKNTIIHEIEHNLGLSHCKNNECIMSAQTGHFENLDITVKRYCNQCKEKLDIYTLFYFKTFSG